MSGAGELRIEYWGLVIGKCRREANGRAREMLFAVRDVLQRGTVWQRKRVRV
jgi:hypothetical protein